MSKEKKTEVKDKYDLSLEAMLKAGVHFGHKKSRWNPKMEKYIFGLRNGVHIIDLEKALPLLEKALERLDEVTKKNGRILIVGTKKQAKDVVKRTAEKMGASYVNDRWLGGTFTNFKVLRKRAKYFIEMTDALEKGKLAKLTKLERNKIQKKLDRIEEKMGGIINMKELPDIVIALDVHKDEAAIKEARKAGIDIIGLVDTNSDPAMVEYPIPANDDALSSIKYFLGVFLKRTLEQAPKKQAEEKK